MSISKELENNYDRILNFFEVKKENMPILNIHLYPQYEQFRLSVFNELCFDVNDMGGTAIEEGLPPDYKLNDYFNRYIYGYSLVEYIINEYGKEGLLELVSSNGNIEEVLNISQTDFNEGWRKFIESKIKK